MAEETIDVDVLEEVIPAEKEQFCTRDYFLRPPDWRYQMAVQYLQDEREQITPTIPSDPYVQYAIRILRAFDNHATRSYLYAMAPDAMQLITLGVYDKHSAIVADIETGLIKGKDVTVAIRDNFYIKPSVYDLYAKIFCDLSGIQAVHSWVHDFLIEPERYNSNTTLLKARLMAYYGGSDMGNSAVVVGPGDDDTQKMMKKIASNEQLKRIFEYIVRATNMSQEDYITVMEGAVKSMTEKDFQEKMRDRDDAGSSSLEELATNLEQGIRAYSQKELESINESGFDFINQYTPVILRKDQDDGKSNI